VVYVVQPTSPKYTSDLDHLLTAAHRIKILNLVVKKFQDDSQFHRRSFKKSWTRWIGSGDGLQALSIAFREVDEPNNAHETQLHWATYLVLAN